MAIQVIEGTWEEIKRYEAELIGHNLRVTIKPEKSARRRPSSPPEAASSEVTKKRLDAMTAWLTLPRPNVVHQIDDSRAGIYGEEEDRG